MTDRRKMDTTSPTPTGAATDDIVERLNEIYWAVEKDRTKDRALDLIRILTVRIETSRAPSPAALGEGEAELAKLLEKVGREHLTIPDAARILDLCPSLLTALTDMRGEVQRLGDKSDAEMLRVKACEHIALGEGDWERLRNECPSTAAVAALRDAYTNMREERERLRAVAINLNAAVDAMWNDPHRRASNHWPKHERAISAAQQDLKAALSQAQDRAGKEKA